MSNKVFVLFCMIFMHIFEDFHLQGSLADMKQEVYWKKICKEYNDNKYRYDWAIALLIHSFEWTFCMLLPAVFTWGASFTYFILFAINYLIHCIVDTLKCNTLSINLTTDQTIHLVQICITWAVFMIVY